MISQIELKTLLKYDEDTGVFFWICKSPTRAKFVGTIAGSVGSKGYINIEIANRTYKAHRLAWLYVHGEHPKQQIDHINHITHDNRLSNLRECSNDENQKNRPMYQTNKTGFTGVHKTKSGKYKAIIRVSGKLISLGTFSDIHHAANARSEADTKYGFHKNSGKLKMVSEV